LDSGPAGINRYSNWAQRIKDVVTVSKVSKVMYMPLSIATSVAGGLLASAVFTQIWKRVDDSGQKPPDPKDLNRSGREALTAAAVQGLVFGLVRAAVDRAAARGYKAVAHDNPT
jgi:hypothetical protein